MPRIAPVLFDPSKHSANKKPKLIFAVAVCVNVCGERYHIFRIGPRQRLFFQFLHFSLVAVVWHIQIVHAQRPKRNQKLWTDVFPYFRRMQRTHWIDDWHNDCGGGFQILLLLLNGRQFLTAQVWLAKLVIFLLRTKKKNKNEIQSGMWCCGGCATHINLMSEHWACEEKCNVGMHVILLQHIVNRWQTFHVFVDRIRWTQECAELHQSILALIVQLAHQFQMVVCRFTVDDAVLLLCHQKAQSDCQIVACQSIFQTLRWFLRVPHLTKVTGLWKIQKQLALIGMSSRNDLVDTHFAAQQFTASHGVQLFRRHHFRCLDASHFLTHFFQYQQIQAETKWHALEFGYRRMWSFSKFTFCAPWADWRRTAANRPIRYCTFCKLHRKNWPNLAATLTTMCRHAWIDSDRPEPGLLSSNSRAHHMTVMSNISANRPRVQWDYRKFEFGAKSENDPGER